MSAEAVRVYYRYSAAENLKSRPPYFSKGLALASFARAVHASQGAVKVTFVVDGPASEPVLNVMSEIGTVVRGSFGSNRSSYRAVISMAAESGYAEPLTWLAEDDYLYEKQAFSQLIAASDEMPEASWFALSGPTPPAMLEMRKAQGRVAIQPLARRDGVAMVDERPWRRIDSTTSTFGGRTLRVIHDKRLLRVVPWTGAAWDRTTCLSVQGVTPYPWRHLASDLVVASTPAERRGPRVVYRLASRVAVNVRSMRLPSNRGILVAPVVPLVGHMNLPYEERPEYWDRVATDVAEWAQLAGLPEFEDR